MSEHTTPVTTTTVTFRVDTPSDHCWHESEIGQQHAAGLIVPVECCWCRAGGVRRYVTEAQPIPGHGPGHTQTRTVARPVDTYAPATCAARMAGAAR